MTSEPEVPPVEPEDDEEPEEPDPEDDDNLVQVKAPTPIALEE